MIVFRVPRPPDPDQLFPFPLTHTHRLTHTTIQDWVLVSEIPDCHQKIFPHVLATCLPPPISNSLLCPPLLSTRIPNSLSKCPYIFTSFIACHFCCQKIRLKSCYGMPQVLAFLHEIWWGLKPSGMLHRLYWQIFVAAVSFLSNILPTDTVSYPSIL